MTTIPQSDGLASNRESGLVAGAREQAVLAAIYQAHSDGLYAFLCARTQDAEAARDLLHDVYVAFFRQPAWDEIADPKAYLFKTAQRLSLNHFRDRNKAREFLRQAAAERGWAMAEDAVPALFDEARRALIDLPVELREVVVLRIYGALTLQEIADTLGLGLATVHARYKQGIERLRKALSGGKGETHE